MSCFRGTDDQLDQLAVGPPSQTIQHGQQQTLQQRGCVGNLVEQTIKHSDGSYRRIFRWRRTPPKNSIARALAATQGNLVGPAVADLASSTTDARLEERWERICPICLEGYEDWKGMDVVLKTCHHEFCFDCILEWIYRILNQNMWQSQYASLDFERLKFTCPCCRTHISGLICNDAIEQSLMEFDPENARPKVLEQLGFVYFVTRRGQQELQKLQERRELQILQERQEKRELQTLHELLALQEQQKSREFNALQKLQKLQKWHKLKRLQEQQRRQRLQEIEALHTRQERQDIHLSLSPLLLALLRRYDTIGLDHSAERILRGFLDKHIVGDNDTDILLVSSLILDLLGISQPDLHRMRRYRLY
ncbi:hypothetical protein HYFRA_00011772 [Hymenoscyphus fraxineus]|uniref:RING-type domain-containing protein n=1 Tax=Hymenoscyphus fraxineus TaxID=746836 RepID=A0A9N9PT69_9HELO|nr:hypothetical protein HYFRA_00011772 [Hymenoscyphus fraxineus]